MKVAANVARSLSFWVSTSSARLSIRSTLLSTSTFDGRISASVRRIASSSSVRPFLASTNNATRSASCVLAQALPTMARSSRRRGEKMPGVSTKISCAAPSMAMPRTRIRVVCTFGVTIEILAPTSALSSVDLPTFGAPISATKPARFSWSAASTIALGDLDARAGEHGGSGRLLGGTLGPGDAFGRPEGGKLYGDAKLGIVVGTGARDFAVDGCREAARLRPFLQHGFWIAQRLRRGAQPHLP